MDEWMDRYLHIMIYFVVLMENIIYRLAYEILVLIVTCYA